MANKASFLWSERSNVPGVNSFKVAVRNLRERRLVDAAQNAVAAADMLYGSAVETAADLAFTLIAVDELVKLRNNTRSLNEKNGRAAEHVIKAGRDIPYSKFRRRLNGIPRGEGNLKALRYIFREYRDAIEDLAERHPELYLSDLTIKEGTLENDRKPALTDRDIDKILRNEPYSPIPLNGIKNSEQKLRTCLENYGYLLAKSQLDVDIKILAYKDVKDWSRIADEARIAQKAGAKLCVVCNEIAKQVEAMPRRKPQAKRAKSEVQTPKPEERDWLNMRPLELMKVE